MNQMLKILEAVSQAYTSKAPLKLVEKFIEALQERNVEVERPHNFSIANYFVGKKKNTVLILAHESTSISWWGVGKQIIDRLIDKEILWGIALIDGDCRRGIWIPGGNLPELTKLKIVTLGKSDRYNFNKSALEKRSDLALEFMTLRRFMKLSGLE